MEDKKLNVSQEEKPKSRWGRKPKEEKAGPGKPRGTGLVRAVRPRLTRRFPTSLCPHLETKRKLGVAADLSFVYEEMACLYSRRYGRPQTWW